MSVLGGLIIILGISSYATVVGLRNGFHGGPFRVREGRVFVWPAEAPPEGKIPKWGVVCYTTKRSIVVLPWKK